MDIMEDDDVYDVVMTSNEETTGFSNLRARFEQAQKSVSAPTTPAKNGAKSVLDRANAFQKPSGPNGTVPGKKPPPVFNKPAAAAAKPGVPSKPEKPGVTSKPNVNSVTTKPSVNSNRSPVLVRPANTQNTVSAKPAVGPPKSSIASRIQNLQALHNQSDTNNNTSEKPAPKTKPVNKLMNNNSFLHKLENVTGGRPPVNSESTDKCSNVSDPISSAVKKSPSNVSVNRSDTIDVPLSGKPSVHVRRLPSAGDDEDDIVLDKNGNRFREWPLPFQQADRPPPKPRKPPKINLSPFQSGEVFEQEVYDDTVLPPTPPAHTKNRPISYIPEYTSDEEQQEEVQSVHTVATIITEETYDDTANPGPEDFYDDGTSNANIGQDDIYEAYDDCVLDSEVTAMPAPPPPITAPPPRPAKTSKDKEAKERDAKREKELKKEQKRKEEEEKKARKLFKMDGTEEMIYMVAIKTDNKSTKTELGATVGEQVEVIRLINNPPGKWLCRNNYNKIGYIDSDRIIPPKPDSSKISQHSDGPEETYDDIAPADDEVFEQEDQDSEVYEEV